MYINHIWSRAVAGVIQPVSYSHFFLFWLGVGKHWRVRTKNCLPFPRTILLRARAKVRGPNPTLVPISISVFLCYWIFCVGLWSTLQRPFKTSEACKIGVDLFTFALISPLSFFFKDLHNISTALTQTLQKSLTYPITTKCIKLKLYWDTCKWKAKNNV